MRDPGCTKELPFPMIQPRSHGFSLRDWREALVKRLPMIERDGGGEGQGVSFEKNNFKVDNSVSLKYVTHK